MMLWPAVAVIGFFFMAALVVVLAQSSTARYEFERNQVQRQEARVLAGVAVGAASGVASQPAAGDGLAELSVAPFAGQPPRELPSADWGTEKPTWWLTERSAVQRDGQVMAGPFGDRIEAGWAALSGGGDAVYGVLRVDGRVSMRQLPEERAWLDELSAQLDRLPMDWDHDAVDDDELVSLAVEVASALVESGLPLHDCSGDGPAGGVCLSPDRGRPGIVVSWHQHRRASSPDVRTDDLHTAVQEAMTMALAESLLSLGHELEPFGPEGRSLLVLG